MYPFGGQRLPGAVFAGMDRSNDKLANFHPMYPSSSSNDNSYNNQQKQRQQHASRTSLLNTEWDKPGSSPQSSPSKEPETNEDPDGLPYDSDEEDPELMRKRKMLQVIEEQIMLKRASLALKTVGVRKTKPRCFTESKPSESNATLRERVKRILQFRKRDIPVHYPDVASRRRHIPVQHDHPLKRRVEAALQQRFVPPPVEPQQCLTVPFLSAPTPLQKDPSPAKEEVKKSNQGFMRFLSVLNKGVDIDKLKEIVNDDAGSMPQSSQNGVQVNNAASSSKSPSIERTRLEDKKPHHKTGEEHKHLQNILDSLGLNFGRDEISRLGDRTQQRLYGKKQSAEREKSQKDVEKYSPGHNTRSSISSSSSASPSRMHSPLKRRRSHSPRRSRRRSSRSQRRRKHSRSPYRSRDSHSPKRSKSPHPRDNQGPHLSHSYSMQPHPYTQYFNPHLPPQMYPNAFCYSQYTAHYNYWTHHQAPLVNVIGSGAQNYPQNIPLPLPGPSQTLPFENNSIQVPPLKKKKKEKRQRCLTSISPLSPTGSSEQSYPEDVPTPFPDLQIGLNKLQRSNQPSPLNINTIGQPRCLVYINQQSIGMYRAKMSKHEKAQMNKNNKMQRKLRNLRRQGGSNAQGTSGMQQNSTNTTGTKRNRKKKKKEKRLLQNGPKLETEDSPAEPDLYDDIPLITKGDNTGGSTWDSEEEEPKPKPQLTQEEVKANLKKVLDAFNSRTKKTVTQPPGLLMPQNLKEDESLH